MAVINVYAQFPTAFDDSGNPSLDPANWIWTRYLIFPLAQLEPLGFLHKPYKWLRSCTGITLGSIGSFSDNPSVPNPDPIFNYERGLHSESEDLYYHTTILEKERMFPVDPLMLSPTGRTTSNAASTRRITFAEEIQARDGRRYVVTGMRAGYCDAVHLAPHARGSAYISAFTSRRIRDVNDMIIEDIDSVRNGLFMNKFLHVDLGHTFALLKTPNFAMNTSDIDPTTPDGDELRVSAQYLQVQPEEPSQFMALGGRENGTPLRIPAQNEGPADWPLDCLLHATYATAVMENFGIQSHKDIISKLWRPQFSPGGSMNAAQDLHSTNEAAQGTKEPRQAKQRSERREQRNQSTDVADEYPQPSTLDLIMNIGYCMLSPEQFTKVMEARRRRVEAAEKEAEAVARKQLEEKVGRWRESTHDTHSDHQRDDAVSRRHELKITPESSDHTRHVNVNNIRFTWYDKYFFEDGYTRRHRDYKQLCLD
ncbi:hypothetical protein C8Q74DRAFT_1437456 [Fomes fomentarius]|nr:hypothetical protein C8Q74DRAFT_1437456 [Fomes fomentarius]